MIKIILAEDHNIVRDGIRNLLEKEQNFEVIAEATNGTEVLQAIQNGYEPDIVLADMIMLTKIDHEKYVVKAFKAGVAGYLLKNISADELVFAINHIHVNGQYICS